MIGIVDVSVQAHNVSMPLYPMRAFEGSPSSIRVRSVPKKIGNWQINKVYFSVAYPDNTTQTIECKLVGGVYVGTIAGCNTVGNVQNGYSIYADGVDENGNAVTDYCLGKGDIQILDARGILHPLQNTKFVQILSSEPASPNDGDMWQTNGAWYVWMNGEMWAVGDDTGLIGELSAELSTKLAIADFNDFKTNEFIPKIQNLSAEITATNGNVATAQQDIESLSSDKLDASTFNSFKSDELTAYALSTNVQNELSAKADVTSLSAYVTREQVEPSTTYPKYASGSQATIMMYQTNTSNKINKNKYVVIHPTNSRFCIADDYYPSWYLSKYNGTTIDPPIEMKWGYFDSTTYWNRRQMPIPINSWAWVATSVYPLTGNTRNRFYIKANVDDDGYITTIDDKLYVSTTAHDITFSDDQLSIATFDGAADEVECTRTHANKQTDVKYFALEDDLSTKADVSALSAYATTADLSTKQDMLADEQVSAIDSVVDKRRTVVDYGNGNISSFNIVGTITSALIPNISTAVDIKLGEAVTEIGGMAFWKCPELTNITIPNSVSTIGGGSLQQCDKLSNITIPNSVKTIEKWAFFECDGLTSVIVPDSVTFLGMGAFYACRNLNTIWIPNTSMRISADAFFQTAPECTVYFKNADLSDVVQMEDCPWGLSNINNIKTWNDASQEWVNEQLTAKADVTDLTSKADVASLNDYQPKLSANQISAINQVLDERQTVIDFGAYGIGRYDWVGELNKDVLTAAGLYNTSQASWTKQPIDVKLGTTISSIGYGVFQSCQQLTSVTMPDSIKSIGGYAFSGCMSLAKADLPSELSSIGDGAFVQNFALSSIHLPSTLKSIGNGAFQYCAMTDLQIAEGVTDIGSGAFTQSDSLKHVEFPASISAIGRNAFQGSNSLTSVVFKDKTFDQVSAMANYPWYISDPGSIITTYTPASQEWVKNYIAQYLQEHNT